jgi:hypothetical protein
MRPLERALVDFMDFLIWIIIVVLKILPFVIIGIGIFLIVLFVVAIICGLKGDGSPRRNPANLGNDVPNYRINNFNPSGIGHQYGRKYGKPVPPNPRRNQ